MRIGLNLLFLIPGEVGGTETYALSLIAAMSRLDKTNQYFLFIPRECRHLDFPRSSSFHTVLCPFRASSRYARFLWEQLVLPWQAKYFHLDLLHSLGYISPLFLPCKSVVTIHDLNFRVIPEAFTPFTRWLQEFFVTHSARRSHQIIAVSEFVRNQLATDLEVPGDKVTTIHEAPKPRQRAAAPTLLWRDLQEHFNICPPYILAFSSLSPHKNIAGLIGAYLQVPEDIQKRWQLVIVGHLPPEESLIRSRLRQPEMETRVIFSGYLPDEQVAEVLSHAGLFVFPSFYEGFGLPVLEAMQAGVPVACSSKGSIPEISGDGSVFFDPGNPVEMSKTLSRVMTDGQLRNDLRRRGRTNLVNFSWEKAAIETLQVYEKARWYTP